MWSLSLKPTSMTESFFDDKRDRDQVKKERGKERKR